MATSPTRTVLSTELDDLETSLHSCAQATVMAMDATCGRWEDMPGPGRDASTDGGLSPTTCTDAEDGALRLLARHQPVGRDLRRIVSLTRVASHLDRAAVLVGHVSGIRRATDSRRLPDDVLATVERLGWTVADLLRDAVAAWVLGDVDLAMGLRDRDESVDDLHQRLLLPSPALRELALDVGRLSRFHERIGDHAVALGDETLFVAGGPRRRGDTVDLRA